MYIHRDLVGEMQGHLHDLAEVEVDDEPQTDIEWLNNTPAEYERLAHSVQEDLIQPTANLNDLMYKSVGIRDSRQSLQLGLSMWRLSWITFIFLPLTFIVSFFGMNVDLFSGDPETRLPSVAWYFLAAGILMIIVLMLWYCVKHSLQRRRQTPYQRGVYENLFNDLESEYPLMWSGGGALDGVEPETWTDKIKWKLLKRWFAPEKTINKKLYTSLGPGGDDADIGSWAQIKKYLLFRWLPDINLKRRPDTDLATAEIAEQGLSTSAPASLHYEPGTVTELAKMSTPVAIADAEPHALQQISAHGLHPHGGRESTGRRRSSGGRYSEEGRPGSRGSSGIMFEERNLSDTESDAGEGASTEYLEVSRKGSEEDESEDAVPRHGSVVRRGTE